MIQAHLKGERKWIFRRIPTINSVNIWITHLMSAAKEWRLILAELGDKDPAAKAAKPDDFIDMRFVAELEKEGFFRKFAIK